MNLEPVQLEYSLLYNKYGLVNIKQKDVEKYTEIDELIANILNTNSVSNKKHFEFKKNNQYLKPQLLKFIESNKDNSYEFKYIKEDSHLGHFMTFLNRIQPYLFKKLKDTDSEVYSEIKIISESNRYQKKALNKDFIQKWTTNTKVTTINI
jgi:hypothetical protein